MKKAEAETAKRHNDWDKEKIKKTAKKISVGAMKYEMIKTGAQNTITFEIDKALSFEGNTAAYLQYAYARIQSLNAKAGEITKLKIYPENLSEEKEYLLILKIAKYPETVLRAGAAYDPSEIAKYLFELSQLFNDYYHSVPVLKSEKDFKAARLFLANAVAQVLENGLGILGIEILNEM
jgi:arginyl-tRNA synthetase